MNKTNSGWTNRCCNPIRPRHPRTGAVGHHREHVGLDCLNC
jgi:hypothetical protein